MQIWLASLLYIQGTMELHHIKFVAFRLVHHRKSFAWAGVFFFSLLLSWRTEKLPKTSKHFSFSLNGLVFLTFFVLLFFFSAFKKIEGFFFHDVFFFCFVFVNPERRRPLVVHKLTSRTSVGVEDWSSSSTPFLLEPICVCWCCCCCCRPSRRLLSKTRSICSWHSFRTSCSERERRSLISTYSSEI